MLGVVACMALSAAVVDSSLTFPSAPPGGPLAGLNSYVTPMTKFVGPQAGDINTTRSGPIELFSGDMCIPAAMHCSGCVIVATTDAILGAACSFEAQYLTMYATGAAAVILPYIDEVPSVDMNNNDGSRGAQTRHLPMLFLRFGPSHDLYNTLITVGPGQNATVSPDVNVWEATFVTWYYQLLLQILPSAVLIASGVTATVYFALHIRVMDGEYRRNVPEVRRSVMRWANYIRKSMGLPHAVLAIDLITDTMCGVVLGIAGYVNTPNVAYPFDAYFVTLLSGWSLASSILSSAVWIRHLSKIIESKALLTRILRGDYPIVFFLLVTVPIALDTWFNAIISTYHNAPLLGALAGAVIFLLQLIVGLHVLAGSDQGMNALLARLSRCVLGMALSMILVCIGTALMTLSSTSLYSPTRWTICFSLFINGRALDSAFRVPMFKPRATWSRTVSTVVPQLPTPQTH